MPIAFGGRKNEYNKEIHYTPEDLFIGSIASCFISTFTKISSNSNFNFRKIKIESEGILKKVNDINQFVKITQNIELTISNKNEINKAKKILEMVEKFCPLANSVKVNIQNNYKINSIE